MISVIIPTFNRRYQLHAMLDSLLRQCDPAEVAEVIVVADGCTDGTEETVSVVAAESLMIAPQLEALATNSGGAHAMNVGARRARGDVLLFLDDDLRCADGLVHAHAVAHANARFDVIMGHVTVGARPTRSFFQRIIHEWTGGWTELLEGRDISYYDSLCSGHFSIRRELFESVGGFDETLRGWGRKDSELGWRLLKVGARFGFAREAVAAQDYSKLPSEFLGDFRRQGSSDVAMCDLHPELRRTVLLSRFHQAPWQVLEARRWAQKDPAAASTVVDVTGRLFDAYHQLGREGSSLEVAFWTTADLAYWVGAISARSPRRFAEEVGEPAAILLYHRIVDDDEQPDAFSVRRATLRRHMEYLRRGGYHVVSLRELVRQIGRGDLPPRTVVLTFDDGLHDFLAAASILDDFGFPATVFVPTAYIGGKATWGAQALGGASLLDADDLRALLSRGFDVQPHGHTHARLRGLSPSNALRDIIESRDRLADLGSAPFALSYPFGSFDSGLAAILRSSGLACGVTCVSTLASIDSALVALPRITVEDEDGESFAFKLRYGIGTSHASTEGDVHMRSFRPTRYWEAAGPIPEDRLFVHTSARPGAGTSIEDYV